MTPADPCAVRGPDDIDVSVDAAVQVSALLYVLARCAGGEHETLGLALDHLDRVGANDELHPLLRATAAQIAARWRGLGPLAGATERLRGTTGTTH